MKRQDSLLLSLMEYHQSGSLAIFVILVACLSFTVGSQHRVGDTAWSIPPNKHFYTNWSNNQLFKIGDNLVFQFQSEFHNVLQVTRRDYETCDGENPLQVFFNGPAIVPLIREGVFYFICNFSSYCLLGQKLFITVHQHFSKAPPSSHPVSVRPPAPRPVSTQPPISIQPPVHFNSSSNDSVRSKSCSCSFFAFLWCSWIVYVLFLVVNY